MNKYLLFSVLLYSYVLKSQTLSVSDNSTREKISGVVFQDSTGQTVSSNSNGLADITTLNKAGTIVVLHASFNTYTLTNEEKSGSKNYIRLISKMVQLDEIILSANRYEEHKIEVPYTVDVIHQKEIEFVNQPTSAELLQNTGAVFVQKSQMGGGSPVLRGFEANKVLLVVDGVRMNNAIYRGGHLQDIITLDANMLERAEILFGPSSTIYGSDALGGVMHFYTKNATFSQTDKPDIHANSFARFASANNEATGHIDFNLGFKKFASMTNITYSDFGDLTSGDTKLEGSYKGWNRDFYAKRFDNRDSTVKNNNPSLQIGTAYSQLDVMQRFNLKTGQHVIHGLNFQLSQSSNIPRYDRMTEMSGNNLKYAEWYYGPQIRLLGAYSLNYDEHLLFSDNIKIIAAYQNIKQERVTRRFQNPVQKTQLETVDVISINTDVYKRFLEKHEFRYGFEIQSNNVVSTAHEKNIVTTIESPSETRYANGGNKMNTFGIYLTHAYERNKNFVITDGLRYTANSLESNFTDTTFFKFPFSKVSQKNSALTGNLGFTWKEENDYKLSLLLNTGFRTPNIDDMSKVFESSGNILIVPNSNIKPEYATNFEMSMSKIVNSNYKFDFTAFYTLLNNVLVLADYKFNGQDSVIYNGTKSKVQAMQNKDKGYIYGFTGAVQFDFNKHVSFKSILNYTYGRYTNVANDTVVPLDHIPPVFGQSSILINEKNMNFEFFVRYNGKKTSSNYSSSGEDNAVYSADPKKGYMPAWFTLNLRCGYNLTSNLRINVACENITNNRYRVFASGVNAAGRNFIFSLRYKF